MTTVAELEKDLEDFRNVFESAKRTKVKDTINLEIRRLELTISKLKADAVGKRSDQGTSEEKNVSKMHRTVTDIVTYAWDQSEKFMKIYVSLKGAHGVQSENIQCEFTERTMRLRISDVENKDYTVNITNLHEDILPAGSYAKTKTDTVLIMMKKKEANRTWPYVTVREAAIKEKGKREKEAKQAQYKDDPSAGLMNMLKDMYEDGDDEMKRTIAKAWTNSQEKRTASGGDGPELSSDKKAEDDLF